MSDIVFTNVRIFDGTGEQPFAGEVLVEGNRIRRVARGSRAIPSADLTVIDGAGATLMPGMCEAHTHFAWNDQPTLGSIQKMPPAYSPVVDCEKPIGMKAATVTSAPVSRGIAVAA